MRQPARRTGRNEITLARAISKFGVASRTQAAAMIREGRVSVNGRVVRSPDHWVDPRSSGILLDGKRLKRVETIYLAMHKPAGVVTTRSDERGRRTIYNFIPLEHHWVFPVGRLDKGTSGLLLLTNDTRFGEKVTNPLGAIPKTYTVTIDRPLRQPDRQAMESPLTLGDGTELLPARVRPMPDDPLAFEITIVEGKNRQIRRMCAHLGYEVVSLHRTRIGPIRIGGLKPGEVRPLSHAERTGILAPLSMKE